MYGYPWILTCFLHELDLAKIPLVAGKRRYPGQWKATGTKSGGEKIRQNRAAADSVSVKQELPADDDDDDAWGGRQRSYKHDLYIGVVEDESRGMTSVPSRG